MNKKLDFFERVYDVVSKIPTGRVSTYGAIACFLGTKNSARVVGILAGFWPKRRFKILNRHGKCQEIKM